MKGFGLLALFAIAVTPFVPTEPALIGMGSLAAAHRASLGAVITVAAVGCCISDHILYLAARLAGSRVPPRLARRVSAAVGDHLTRWAAPGLVAGRWLPAGGTAAALAAGACRCSLSRFTPASAVGSSLWSCYATLLGYTGAALTGQPLLGMLVGGPVALVAVLLARTLRRRQASTGRVGGRGPVNSPSHATVDSATAVSSPPSGGRWPRRGTQ